MVGVDRISWLFHRLMIDIKFYILFGVVIQLSLYVLYKYETAVLLRWHVDCVSAIVR